MFPTYKTGAPYAIQLKSAFGTKGSSIPVLIRGLPAIVWYGFQTWLGGAALNKIGASELASFFSLFTSLIFSLLFLSHPGYFTGVIYSPYPTASSACMGRLKCYPVLPSNDV